MKNKENLQDLLKSKDRRVLTVIPKRVIRLSVFSVICYALGIGVFIGSLDAVSVYASLIGFVVMMVGVILGSFRNYVETKILIDYKSISGDKEE